MAGKRCILFGSGASGKRFITNNVGYHIVAIADNNVALAGSSLFGIPVIKPEAIRETPFDVVVITIMDRSAQEAIREQLLGYGVRPEQIEVTFTSGASPLTISHPRVKYLQELAFLFNLRGIGGNVAECGVYRGDYTYFINEYFPHRRLYLFDTFSGFPESSLVSERALGNSFFTGGIFDSAEMFSNTCIQEVLDKLPYPDNVVVKAGFFPETAADVGGTFCFVSLDMDLYKPMLDGLRFFWERMERGGVIALHDYLDVDLPGVWQAVEEFEKGLGSPVPKLPIGDGSSLAILKP